MYISVGGIRSVTLDGAPFEAYWALGEHVAKQTIEHVKDPSESEKGKKVAAKSGSRKSTCGSGWQTAR
jgi:hypothetical protein